MYVRIAIILNTRAVRKVRGATDRKRSLSSVGWLSTVKFLIAACLTSAKSEFLTSWNSSWKVHNKMKGQTITNILDKKLLRRKYFSSGEHEWYWYSKNSYITFWFVAAPPNSPDLAPLDYPLFLWLKKNLVGQRFSTDE